MASLGFDIDELVRRQRLVISAIPIDPSELVAAGEFDLEDLFVRLDLAVATLARQIDLLKGRGITAALTTLKDQGEEETGAMAVSSLTDTWLLLCNVERDQERNRLLFVIKSRGMAHSKQVREFVLTCQGAELLEVAIGPQGVLTGSARELQQARLKSAATNLEAEIERRRSSLERHAAPVEAQIEALRLQLLAERAESAEFFTKEKHRAADQVDGQLGAGRQRGESR